MADQFKKGDKVEWNTSQGKTTGEVEKKLTSPTDIKGHHVAASEDNPEYLVKSDKSRQFAQRGGPPHATGSGKEAAHKPDALKKVEE